MHIYQTISRSILIFGMLAAIPSANAGPASDIKAKVYSDGRPSAHLRMDAKDQGVILKHGDGPGQCDIYGAREALIFKENDIYHLFYDGAGPPGWRACLATSKDLKTTSYQDFVEALYLRPEFPVIGKRWGTWAKPEKPAAGAGG